jgi:diguanylate cyclase (GGDEF)-like protein
MFLDLDRFKTVNDQLDHDVGDQLLKAVAADLPRLVRQVVTVARLGGDESVIALDKPGTRGQVEVLAQSVVTKLGLPRTIDGHAVGVGASVGIALYPSDGLTAAALIASADEALYAAKGAGRNTPRFYSAAARL